MIHKNKAFQLSGNLLIAASLLISLLPAGLLSSSAIAAPAANTVYLTPASSSVLVGNQFTLDLRVNPATTASGGYDGIDGVVTTIRFNSGQLQYIGVDGNGSAFPADLGASAGSGQVEIARGLNRGQDFVRSDALVTHIKFKALVSGATSAVTLSGTEATHGQPYTHPAAQGASVSLTAPAPATCPAGKVGTPPNCTSPPTNSGGAGNPTSSGGPAVSSGPSSNQTGTSGGSSNTSAAGSAGNRSTGGSSKPANGGSGTSGGGTTAPTSSAGGPVNTGNATIESKKIAFTNADFSITTPKPSQVYIQYGLSSDALSNSTEPDALGTSHTVALDPKQLTPGETYYYTVVTKDETGAITSSDVQSFTMKGMTVSIGVFDKNNQPLKRQKVTLHSKPSTAVTDDKGYVVFSNVIPGDHQLSYTKGKQEYQQPLTVTNNSTVKDGEQIAPMQEFSIVYELAQSKSSAVPAVIGILLVGLIGGGAFFVLRTRRHKPTATTSGPIIAGGSGTATPSAAAHISNTPFVRETAPIPATPASEPIAAAPLITPIAPIEPQAPAQPTVTAQDPIVPPAPAPIDTPVADQPEQPSIETIKSDPGPAPGSMFTPSEEALRERERTSGL